MYYRLRKIMKASKDNWEEDSEQLNDRRPN